MKLAFVTSVLAVALLGTGCSVDGGLPATAQPTAQSPVTPSIQPGPTAGKARTTTFQDAKYGVSAELPGDDWNGDIPGPDASTGIVSKGKYAGLMRLYFQYAIFTGFPMKNESDIHAFAEGILKSDSFTAPQHLSSSTYLGHFSVLVETDMHFVTTSATNDFRCMANLVKANGALYYISACSRTSEWDQGGEDDVRRILDGVTIKDVTLSFPTSTALALPSPTDIPTPIATLTVARPRLTYDELQYGLTFHIFMVQMEQRISELDDLFPKVNLQSKAWRDSLTEGLGIIRKDCLESRLMDAPLSYEAVQEKVVAGCNDIIDGVDYFNKGLDELDKYYISKGEEHLQTGWKMLKDAKKFADGR